MRHSVPAVFSTLLLCLFAKIASVRAHGVHPAVNDHDHMEVEEDRSLFHLVKVKCTLGLLPDEVVQILEESKNEYFNVKLVLGQLFEFDGSFLGSAVVEMQTKPKTFFDQVMHMDVHEMRDLVNKHFDLLIAKTAPENHNNHLHFGAPDAASAPKAFPPAAVGLGQLTLVHFEGGGPLRSAPRILFAVANHVFQERGAVHYDLKAPIRVATLVIEPAQRKARHHAESHSHEAHYARNRPHEHAE